MTLKDLTFAALLLASCASVVVGIGLVSTPAAWICGGGLGGVWSWLVLSGDR